MKVQHFFAYQKSWTDKRGEFFWPHVPPSRPKNPKQILDQEKMNVRHIFA